MIDEEELEDGQEVQGLEKADPQLLLLVMARVLGVASVVVLPLLLAPFYRLPCSRI